MSDTFLAYLIGFGVGCVVGHFWGSAIWPYLKAKLAGLLSK